MGLIITGMHRSGTSALARVTDAIGVPSGGPDMGPAPDNPRGFFERRDVMKVNDSWLADLGGSWWAPPETTSTTWRTLDRDRLAADRSALGLFDPGHGPWMVKDPRISLVMPLWDRLALQTLPAVVAVRDPREVASSLELRNGMPARRALALWIAYVAGALSGAHGRSMLVVDFGSLLSQPGEAVSSLSEFIVHHCDVGTPVPSLEVLVALVESDLNRNRGAVAHGVSEAELADVMDIYAYVTKAHLEPEVQLDTPGMPEWARDALSDSRDVWAAQQAADAAGQVIEDLERELRDAALAVEGARAAVDEVQALGLQREALARQLDEVQELLQSERQAREAADLLRAEADQRALSVAGELEQRSRELEVLEQELGRARLNLVEAEERLEQMRRVSEGASQQIEVLQEDVSRRVNELAVVEGLIATLQADHETRAISWEADRLALLERADEAGSAADVLAAELDRVREEAQEARERLTQAESHLDWIRRESAQQLQSAEDARRDLERHLTAQEAEATQLRLSLASTAAEVQARTSEIAQLQRLVEVARHEHSRDMASWDRERADLSRQLEESGSASGVLRAELERARLALAQGQQELALLQQDLSAREQDLVTLGEKLDATTVARDGYADQVSLLESSLADLREQHSASATSWGRDREMLTRDLEEAKQASAGASERMADLSTELTAVGDALLETQRESQALKTMQRRHEGIMIALTEQLARKTGLVGSLTSKLVDAEKRRSDAEELAGRLNQDLEVASLRITAMETDLDAEHGRAQESKKLLEEARIEVTQLQAEANRLRASTIVSGEILSKAQDDRDTLQADVDRLETRLNVVLNRASQLSDRSRLAEEQVASLELAAIQTSQLLDSEVERSGRLAEALIIAIREGQSLLAEIDGLKASRSYRYGRALTALGRALVGGPAVPPRIPAMYVVPGADPSDVVNVVREGSFDAQWYLATYSDVARAGVDPLSHYVSQGRREGRLPGPRSSATTSME